MNLEANNLEGDLNKSLDDIVKGMKKGENKKGRRGHGGRGRGAASRGQGLAYARRSPAGNRGGAPRDRHEQPVRGRRYVQVVAREQYRRQAPRYVETRYRYAPVYVTRYPRYQVPRGGRGEFRRVAEEPVRVRYEEIPRRDIRIEGTARAPRLFDRLDANRTRRRQEFARHRQESNRSNNANNQRRQNKN